MPNGDTIGPSGVPRITIFPPRPAPTGFGGLAPIGEEPEPATGATGFEGLAPIGAEEAERPEAAKPPPPPSPVPATSTSQQLLTDFLNQRAAAGQRTTPIVSAYGKALGPALQNDEGDIGYQGPDGQFVATDQNKHVLLTDPADNVPKIYLRTEKTSEGGLASTGRLLGTGAMADIMFSGGPLDAARRATEAAARIGVPVPKAIIGTPSTQFLGQVSAGMPGGTPLREAIEESRQALGGAAERAAEATGGVPSAVGAGERFSETAQQAVRPGQAPTALPVSRLGAAAAGVSNAYREVEALVDPNLRVPLTNTMATASDIVARRGAAARPGFGKAIDQIIEGATRPQGMTFAGIKDARTAIGEMLDTGVFPEGMSEAELRRIYGALSEDLRVAANASGRHAGVAFERANRLNVQLEQWKERLRRIIGTRSGESIYNTIARMASAAPGSADLRGLAIARASVPAPVWQDIAATAISRLGRDAAGEFSPARFVSDYSKLSPQGKAQLFGGIGSQEVPRFLDDLVKVSNRFREGGRLANVSRTAGHLTAPLAILEALRSVTETGSFREPLVVIGALIGNTTLARVLARPATAASLARWAHVYEHAVTAGGGGPAAVPLLVRATNNFYNTMNGELGTDLKPPQELLPGLRHIPLFSR